MAKVFPFCGITYNGKKLKDLSVVMSPPYDVISPEKQEELYQKSDFNFVRLILGKEFNGDSEYNNRYVRAAAFLSGWLRHKIMVQEEKPVFYAYEQVFKSPAGGTFSRLGFFGLLRLEELGRGKIFPHEETYPKAKLDRLQLIRSTNANLDSIFGLYDDEKEKINKTIKPFTRRKPFIEVKDKDRVIHRLWKIDRKPAITKIIKEMRDKSIFIADGHHRYEAALRYRNELKMRNTKFTEDESYNHVLMYFTPLADKGLVVLPIHRVVRHLPYFEPARFLQDLAQYFELKEFPAAKKTAAATVKKLFQAMEKNAARHAFGIYLGNYRYLLATLKDEGTVEELVAEEKPSTWKKLDVTILHYVVFDRILGIGHETEDKVVYFKAAEKAIEEVDQHGANMAILLNPTRIEDIVTIAGSHEKMPHKSTYFYPKLLSGLVVNRFDPHEKLKS